MNPISSINSFMNKQFGVPLPKAPAKKPLYPTPTTTAPVQTIQGANGPVPIRNDMQANNTYGVTSSNVGATATKPTAIAPVTKTSTLPPSGQAYAQTLASPAAQNQSGSQATAQNGLSTIPGPYDPATGKLKDPAASAGATAATASPTAPESPYLAYLKSMFDPEQLSSASRKSTEANQRLADIQAQEDSVATKGRHRAEDALDAPGGSKAGAEASSDNISRLTNRELADLSTQEGAAARTAAVYKDTYDSILGAGKSVFEAEQGAEKAAQDQANKDRDFTQTETKLATDKASDDRKFAEDKRQFGLEYALEQQKANAPKALTAAQEAKQIADQEKEVAANQSASQSIGIVNNLLADDRYKSISGATQTGSIPFLGDRDAKNQYEQLQGLLKLGIRGLIKGQGAVSDYEGKILGQAASSLDRGTSEGQFQQALQTVRGVLKTNNGQTTVVEVTNPETGEKITANLSGDEIYHLTNDGNLIKYK